MRVPAGCTPHAAPCTLLGVEVKLYILYIYPNYTLTLTLLSKDFLFKSPFISVKTKAESLSDCEILLEFDLCVRVCVCGGRGEKGVGHAL